MRILLVEDTIGEPVQAILHRWDHDVVLATSGAAAREHLRVGGFDLFLFDWILPDGSGLDLVRTVRADARYRSIPVLMMSSRTDRDDIVTAVRTGVDAYVAKPFRPQQLRSRIDEALQRRSRQRSLFERVRSLLEGQTPLDRHGEGPLLVLGEGAIGEEDLESASHAPVLDYLSTMATTVAATNAFLPGLDLGYALCQTTGDVTKLMRQRATADRVQLAVVAAACYGNCVVMARLLHLRDGGRARLAVVTDHWSDLTPQERSELEQLDVPVFRRTDIDTACWRDILETRVIQQWSPKLHEQFVDTGLRDDAVWEDLSLPDG